MAQTEPERAVQQSVIDRLTDLDSASQVEAPLTRAQSVRQFKAGLKRDLEWLLNTRRTIEPVPSSCGELQKSLFFYGFPDITSVTLGSARDEQRLLKSMETAIAIFEPRLAQVRVTAMQPLTKQAHSLRFQIEGLMLIEPAPELISFDTVLDTSRGNYQVKED